MKKHLLHSETRKDGVFDFIVNFLCKLPHFDQCAADQGNYRVEDFLEKLGFEYCLSVILDHIKNGFARCHLDLGVSVIKLEDDSLHDLFKKLIVFSLQQSY